jgi:hypothetical protein
MKAPLVMAASVYLISSPLHAVQPSVFPDLPPLTVKTQPTCARLTVNWLAGPTWQRIVLDDARALANASHAKAMAFCILATEEGYSPNMYMDTTGHATTGFGHKLTLGASPVSQPMAEEEAVALLAQDLEKAWAFGWTDDRMKVVWTCMTFQLGNAGATTFQLALKCAAEKDDPDYRLNTAKELLNSKWARTQTPARAWRLANLLVNGVYSHNGVEVEIP